MDLIQRKKEAREKKINKLANYISSDFIEANKLDIEKILSCESIHVYYDQYEDCFDGLLTFDLTDFHIHLNVDKGNFKGSKRSRFSIAHELGHYFIPEHNQSIINGTFPCHPSSFKPNQNNIIEREADYFAACLLMPSKLFKTSCYRKKFSLNLVDELSDVFNVSKTSALLRFADIDAGTYPLMIFFFRNGVLSGYKKSSDFPLKDVPFKTKIGKPPPKTSVIGEYYLNNETKFKEVIEVSVDDWFWIDSNQKLNEQCFYSDYDYDISILWPD
jgi:Zn-dependent peptidase ImmA (M78 family)